MRNEQIAALPQAGPVKPFHEPSAVTLLTTRRVKHQHCSSSMLL